MIIKIPLLLSLLYNVLLGQIPTPPDPQQYIITSETPKSFGYDYAMTNYVDRLAGLFRLDTTGEEGSAKVFYYAAKQIGYNIQYHAHSTTCTKINQNHADRLQDWQTLAYAGKTKAISQPDLECNMWRLTMDEDFSVSMLASVENNKPIEGWQNSFLVSVITKYIVGPATVPKHVFDLPVDEDTCE